MKRWTRRIAGALAALLVILAAALLGLLYSGVGARMVLARIVAGSGGLLTVERSEGAIAGPLVLHNVRWHDKAVIVHAERVLLDVAPWAVLKRHAHVENVEIDGLTVKLTTLPAEPAASPSEPFSLVPPLDITLDRLMVTRLALTTDGQPTLAVDSIEAEAGWTLEGMRLKRLAVRAPEGSVDLEANLLSLAPYAGGAKGQFDWRLGDIRYAGTLDATSTAGKATAHAVLTQPAAADLRAAVDTTGSQAWDFDLAVPAFSPSVIVKDTALQSVALTLKGNGSGKGGSISGQVGVNGHTVLVDPLQFGWENQVLSVQALTLRSPEASGRLDVTGSVDLTGGSVATILGLTWSGVVLPEDLAGQVLHSDGRLDVAGTLQEYGAKGTVKLGPPGKIAEISLDVAGTAKQVLVNRLALQQPRGYLQAQGTVTLAPSVAWKGEVRAERFDPGALVAGWPGSLGLTLHSEGSLADAGVTASVKLDKLDGTLRQRPVTGTADIRVSPGLVIDGTLALASGESTVAIRGRGGHQTDATVGFTIQSLGDLLPGAQGRVKGEWQVKGAWPALALNGRLDGQSVSYDGTKAGSVELTADIADASAPRGNVSVLATGVAQGNLHFERVSIDGKGDRNAHTLTLALNGDPLSGQVTVRGANTDANWNGMLETLNLSLRDQPQWTLQQPVTLSWREQALHLGELCLTASGPRLCLAGDRTADGATTARYRIERLPLAMVMVLAAPDAPFTLQGEIDGSGDVAGSAQGQWRGSARIGSARGQIGYPDAAKPVLDYRDVAIEAALSPEGQDLTLRAAFADGGRVEGRVQARGASQVLDGTITLAIANLSLVELFTTDLAAVKGRANGSLHVGGTLAQPQVDGTLRLLELGAEVPAAGITLQDGTASVTVDPSQQVRIEGGIRSGTGQITFTGSGDTRATTPILVSIEGKDFLAADIPGARVVVGPHLKLEYSQAEFRVSGQVDMPSANVDLSKLPGGGVAKTSPDVVVTDEEAAAVKAALPVVADVTLRLGDDVRLKGFGLDGKLDGQLAIVERPGRQTVGRGEVRVGGTYRAYGQDLRIETGRLLFAGTAIDNPGLDLRAVRDLKDVKPGLRVQGTAQVPVLTVFAEPAMEQSEALSYLITGKPLSGLKGGDTDLVRTAAQALGSATGDLLAKSIGARLGIEAEVRDNAGVGGTAFTVGKYLSPKLYIGYGVGIFQPGEVITLRYKLSKRWELEAQNATVENRAGLNYRYEK
ncbi:translocation/assembly module TamB domain-containing protein [Tahibacter amnicola]|uniref:Translocation/assembly module TamB domain-containing protein n=1 Tax=Tahibacter amnicola TaxID=2976241 RepID=A0ABY6BEL5_9GAMM|nr:translocation/assembly module TamB domain-containing protein [Tahibacter amnicola]UXI67550.1 translocation/assembly module TamB domain-containing protein [Tahibacter amnicola]